MGLSSGGGGESSSSNSGLGGFALGYLLGSSNDDSDGISVKGAIGIIAVGALTVGGIITATAFSIKDKKEAKQELNNLVANQIEAKSVDISYFDWTEQDNNYFFKFTGSAVTLDNKNVDFFSSKYSVNEKEYYDILKYIDANEIKDLDKSSELLKKITKIITNAELVSNLLKENIATSAYEKTSSKIILNVSKAKAEDDCIAYYVCYTEAVKNDDGKIGLLTHLNKVSFAKSADLEKYPSKVFSLENDKADVKEIKSNFTELNPNEFVQLSGENALDM